MTTVYVTHDQVEAMTLGQRVAVLRDGLLQQVDRPQELYHRPANLFVAAFIGSPSMNLVEADVDGGEVRFAGHTLRFADGLRPPDVSGRVVLGIRPTDFEHAESASLDQPRMRVHADVVEDLGSESHVIFTIDAPRVSAEAVRAATETTADDEGKLFADDRAVFTACVDTRRLVRAGADVDLAVDHRRLHFFDPASGLALRAGAPAPAAA